MTAHELARKLLEMPDLPVWRHGREDDYRIANVIVTDIATWEGTIERSVMID